MLRGGNLRMPQNLAHALYRHTVRDCHHCIGVTAHMESQFLVYSAFCRYLFQQDIRPPVPVEVEQAVAPAERLVTVDDFAGTIHQLHAERHFRLLPDRGNPQATVYRDKVVGGEVLDVDERYSRQASEYEQVADNRHCRVIETVRHERPYLFFREELPLLRAAADTAVGERVSRYQSVLVRMGHDGLQCRAVEPDGGLLHTHLVAEVDAILVHEVLRQLVHAEVVPLVVILDEVRHVGTGYRMLVVRFLCPVLAHTLGKVLVMLVESTEQCLVFRADALIGVAHHFRRDIRLAVGNTLVVLDDLRLDIVEGKVDVTRLLAFPFYPVRLGVPLLHRNGMPATELRLRPVDCHSSHDGDISVSLLAPVHEEQHLECRSHTRLLFCCKINFTRAKWL